jgi:hypothetical protein
MGKHLNKIIAPVIVTICLSAYYIVFGMVIIKSNIPSIVKITGLIISIIITIVVVMVLIERIKEINGGEEDDLGKY